MTKGKNRGEMTWEENGLGLNALLPDSQVKFPLRPISFSCWLFYV